LATTQSRLLIVPAPCRLGLVRGLDPLVSFGDDVGRDDPVTNARQVPRQPAAQQDVRLFPIATKVAWPSGWRHVLVCGR